MEVCFFCENITQELTLWLVGAVMPRTDPLITTPSPAEIGHETVNSMKSPESHLPENPGSPALLEDHPNSRRGSQVSTSVICAPWKGIITTFKGQEDEGINLTDIAIPGEPSSVGPGCVGVQNPKEPQWEKSDDMFDEDLYRTYPGSYSTKLRDYPPPPPGELYFTGPSGSGIDAFVSPCGFYRRP